MRISRFVSIAALVLAPVAASAQTPTAKPATETPTVTTGWVDFGVRGTDLKGDPARYERYRDLTDGLYMNGFGVSRETRGWFLDFSGDHLFANDQRLVGAFVKPGKFKARFMYDQIPMLMSRSTQTLYSGVGVNMLTIPDLLQQQVQLFKNNINWVVAGFAEPFTLSSRRHIGEGSLEYAATPDLTFRTTLRRMNRQGVIPFGASFGHSSVVELPAPVSHTLTDSNGSGEWMHDRLLLRVGYTGSWFHNDFSTITFDNPYQLTDTTSIPGSGRTALPPSSTLLTVNGLASVSMPHHTRASAFVSMGSLKDGGVTIMPYTINSAVTGLNPFPRTTVNGEGRTTAANLTFTSRPSKYVDVSARYRTYDYENRTPEFTVFQRVSYDNAVSNSTAPIETEPFGIVRHNFDLDFRTTPVAGISAGVGYSRIEEDRDLRVIPDSTENVARFVFDAISTKWFSVRTKFEHSQKRGDVEDADLRAMAGCPVTGICDDTVATAEHVGTRHFDIADRDRNRLTLLTTASPISQITFGASVAHGKDEYQNVRFGLRNNRHWIYGGSIDAVASDHASFGVSYTHEDYRGLQASRQVNSAAPSPAFLDSTADWVAEGHDNVNAIVVSADFLRIRDKVDVRFSYDFNRSTSDYNYLTGPVPELSFPDDTFVASNLPAPVNLPIVLSELQRGTAEVTYSLTPRVDIGMTYWYERFDTQDFTLDEQAIPTLGLTSAVLMGYLYRPYTANTVFGRLIVRF